MTETATYTKPLPTVTNLNRPFWEALKRHELRMQKCQKCGHLWYPIGPVCPQCLHPEYDWTPLSGRGTVLSWIVFHQVYNQAFKDDVPYNVILVELEEGTRMFSNLVGIPNDQIHVGMSVEAVFDDVTDEITLPRFRPVGHQGVTGA